MSRKFLSFYATLLMCVGMGCAKSSRANPPLNSPLGSSLDRSVAITTGDSSDEILSEASVFCKDSTECSPSVGLLASRFNATQVAQCTTFLISPDLIMTNSHCIPPELKVSGSGCSGQIIIQFPAVKNYENEKFDCTQVVFASDLPSNNTSVPDYAILKLSHDTARPPLTISRAGLSDHGNYKILKVNPAATPGDGKVVGSLDSVNCTAIHNSMLIANSGSDLSKNMSVDDCTIVHGNSGSPIVDSNNQVHGIIQMEMQKSKLDLILLNKKYRQTDPAMSALAGGTNFACIDFPKDFKVDALPAGCSSLDSKSDVKSPDDIRLEKQLEEDVSHDSSAIDRSFGWEAIQYRNTDSFILVPKCLKDTKALLDERKRTDTKAEISFQVPKVDLTVDIDRYFVPTMVFTESSTEVSLVLDYSPKDLASKKSTDIVVNDAAKTAGPIKSITLEMCDR